MTTRTKLTPKTLALQAHKLSGDIDSARWALAELAAAAKAEGVPCWAEIIGIECRREPRTVMAWAATWGWCADNRVRGWVAELPYSFFECASNKAGKLSFDVLIELLKTYEGQAGATLESFRAELSTLAGEDGDNAAVFRSWAEKEGKSILGWVDRAPTRRAADCLRLAADALADAVGAN